MPKQLCQYCFYELDCEYWKTHNNLPYSPLECKNFKRRKACSIPSNCYLYGWFDYCPYRSHLPEKNKSGVHIAICGKSTNVKPYELTDVGSGRRPKNCPITIDDVPYLLAYANAKVDELHSSAKEPMTDKEFFERVSKYEKKIRTEGHYWEVIDWTYKCNKCGRIEKRTAKYCPNCGAKMESEVEDGKID